MLSTKTDHENDPKLNKLFEYEPIFRHYGFGTPGQLVHRSSIEMNDDLKRDAPRTFFDRNESNKKTINAKTVTKKPQKKKKSQNSSTKIKVPNVSKSTHSKDQQKQSKSNPKSPKATASVPIITVYPPSTRTKKKVKNSTASELNNQPVAKAATGEPNATKNSQDYGKEVTLTAKLSDDLESVWDLDVVNAFTREMFKCNNDNTKLAKRPNQVRLNCGVDPDDYLRRYVQTRSRCLDNFEEYVIALKRQHGIIQAAASDKPIFDPGITVTGPSVQKDKSFIDKEDSYAIKRINSIEPRKKYALIHEKMGIFIIGGYNLYVDIPVQKEPVTDYLIKSNKAVQKIPRLHPCRVHFGIYADGKAIYIAGGQTLQNELLADIQRLNLQTLTWEHVTTLMNPVAACGMTLDNNRIYLIGGYEIFQKQTVFLMDYTIYNLSSKKFEKATRLPSPRCRSLVFATNNAIFCVSGLIQGYDENNNKKMKISTDILKWTPNTKKWIKVSKTPELTKFHGLAFNEPYLEITKRIMNDQGDEVATTTEGFYDFRTNVWVHGREPPPPP